MTRRLLASYLSITLFALIALVYPLGQTFAEREREQTVVAIERDAIAFASLAEDDLEVGADALPGLHPEVRRYLEQGGGRLVIVDPAGISVLDSDDLDGPRTDFSTRPELTLALAGERNSGTRFSTTVDTDLFYVAIPVASGGEVHGAARITFPTSAIEAGIRAVWFQLGLLSVVVLAAVAAIGFVLARSVTRPVRTLEAGARALADGRLDQRVPTDSGAPELRTLASTFNETADRLQRLVEGQRAFVADASHQLRSPLTALRLRLETIDGDPDGSDQPRLDAAIAEVDRLNRLVDALLVLARAGETRPDTEAVDPAVLVHDRLAHWEPTARNGQVNLEADLGLELPEGTEVRVIPGTLEMVLDNLIDNAIQAAPPGSTVTVSLSHQDSQLRLRVTDQGPGLSPDQRARAFDRFWRAPGNSRRGSGLGLAIVADLMTANGGRAELDEGPGGGLEVRLTLPAGAATLTVP